MKCKKNRISCEEYQAIGGITSFDWLWLAAILVFILNVIMLLYACRHISDSYFIPFVEWIQKNVYISFVTTFTAPVVGYILFEGSSQNKEGFIKSCRNVVKCRSWVLLISVAPALAVCIFVILSPPPYYTKFVTHVYKGAADNYKEAINDLEHFKKQSPEYYNKILLVFDVLKSTSDSTFTSLAGNSKAYEFVKRTGKEYFDQNHDLEPLRLIAYASSLALLSLNDRYVLCEENNILPFDHLSQSAINEFNELFKSSSPYLTKHLKHLGKRQLGNLLYRLGRYNDSIAIYEELIVEEKSYATAANLVTAYVEAGRFSEAITMGLEYVDVYRDNVNSRRNGHLKCKFQQADGEDLAELEIKYIATLLNNVGFSYMMTEKYDEAVKFLASSFRYNQKKETFMNLIFAKLFNNKGSEALRMLSAFQNENQDHFKVSHENGLYLLLGLAHRSCHDTKLFEEYLFKYIGKATGGNQDQQQLVNSALEIVNRTSPSICSKLRSHLSNN